MRLTTLKSKLATLPQRLIAPANADRLRGRAAVGRRRRIMLRDGCACRGCGRITTDGQADHIVPLHVGGADADENLQWLCIQCHDAKTAREAAGRARQTA